MLVIITSLIFYNIQIYIIEYSISIIYCQDLDSLNISTKYDYIIIIDFMLIMIISTKSKISFIDNIQLSMYTVLQSGSHIQQYIEECAFSFMKYILIFIKLENDVYKNVNKDDRNLSSIIYRNLMGILTNTQLAVSQASIQSLYTSKGSDSKFIVV